MPLLILFVLFVAEVATLVAVGAAIGTGWAVLLFVGTTVAGGLLLGRQGRTTMVALREAQARGRNPGRALADGALGGVGALLLVLPGLLTDVVGLLLLLPPTRALVRPLVAAAVTRKVLVVPTFGRGSHRGGPGGGGDVIDGEVLDVDDPGPQRTPVERGGPG